MVFPPISKDTPNLFNEGNITTLASPTFLVKIDVGIFKRFAYIWLNRYPPQLPIGNQFDASPLGVTYLARVVAEVVVVPVLPHAQVTVFQTQR